MTFTVNITSTQPLHLLGSVHKPYLVFELPND
jgi:hypothetical protein